MTPVCGSRPPCAANPRGVPLRFGEAEGNLEGTLTTLDVTAPIALVPNARKAKDNEPDYRIVSRKNGSSSVLAGTASARPPARNTSRSVSPPPSSARSAAMWRRRPVTIRRRGSSSGTPPADRCPHLAPLNRRGRLDPSVFRFPFAAEKGCDLAIHLEPTIVRAPDRMRFHSHQGPSHPARMSASLKPAPIQENWPPVTIKI